MGRTRPQGSAEREKPVGAASVPWRGTQILTPLRSTLTFLGGQAWNSFGRKEGRREGFWNPVGSAGSACLQKRAEQKEVWQP